MCIDCKQAWTGTELSADEFKARDKTSCRLCASEELPLTLSYSHDGEMFTEAPIMNVMNAKRFENDYEVFWMCPSCRDKKPGPLDLYLVLLNELLAARAKAKLTHDLEEQYANRLDACRGRLTLEQCKTLGVRITERLKAG